MNPTDRIIDTYRSSSAAIQTMMARGLTDTSHTVRITNTGYANVLATNDRLSFVGSTGDTIWWGTGDEDLEDTVNVRTKLIHWLMNETSSAEVAITAYPSGGSNTGYLGGKSHGYENEVSISFTMDGSPVTPSDGEIIMGTELVVVKSNQLHHSFDASPLADFIATYTLNSAGLDLDIYIEWLRAGTFITGYLGMATWEHFRRDNLASSWPTQDTTERARWDEEIDFNVGLNAGASHDAPTTTSAHALWQTGYDFVGQWVVGHWVKNAGQTTKLWFQDRNVSTLDKIYPEIESGSPATGAFTAGQTLEASVRYCAKPFTNPDATFGS